MRDFDRVKQYLSELGFQISHEDAEEALVVINAEEQGIKNLIIDCEDPIVILEQFIFGLSSNTANDPSMLRRLLQMNRGMVHGAFAIDEAGERVLFRDTLQLANLDLNELEASIQALSLALAENATELMAFAHQAMGTPQTTGASAA